MRGNKNYQRNIYQQAYDRLTEMCVFGESKQKAKQDGTAEKKIFSISTFETYLKHINYFIKWVEKTHPECKKIKHAKKYVKEYLEYRDKQPQLSAYTIHLEAKALGKLYQIKPGDKEYYEPRERKRSDIKRSRGEAKRDKNFSEKNNWELVCFCRGTGLRRMELGKLKGGDCKTKKELERRLYELETMVQLKPKEEKEMQSIRDILEQFPTEQYFVWVEQGKGGKPRYSPIIGDNKQKIYDRIKNTPEGKKVWEYVNSNADIHNYRAEYATALYKTYARNIEDIPYDKINAGNGKRYKSDVYYCRGDEKGKKLDKKAMIKVTKALGHNRISVIADHYLRNL